MIYLSGCVRDSLPPEMGVMVTPMMGNKLPDGRTWAADNGCFSTPEKFTREMYLAFLEKNAYAVDRCLFATMPDVVGDAAATLDRVEDWPVMLREMGYRPALIAQDGLESLDVPWDSFDVLFIGGTTDWKLGTAAEALCRDARERGKWVHVGRVNTQRRIRYFAHLADSVDGTTIAFGPNINAPRVASWVSGAKAQLRMEAV